MLYIYCIGMIVYYIFYHYYHTTIQDDSNADKSLELAILLRCVSVSA